ncbi:MAG TPA: ATP-binding protein [Longimicrobiaceae bacterium]|nr:ATP-binding protein [Longimicrobiaceae bacterium]
MRASLRAGQGGGETSEFVLELPSNLGVIEAAVAYIVERCKPLGLDDSRVALNLRVGVTEALANAILYGNRKDPSKHVRVNVRLDRSRLSVRVEDQGKGFDPDAVPDPTLPANLLRPGGRGIFLIRHLMDEVEFNDRGNVICLILYSNGSGSPGQGE